MDIGNKVRNLRQQCGLTQEELADRCELTKGYISQLENNLTSPSIQTLTDLLQILGCTLSDFFIEDNEQVIFSEDSYFNTEYDGYSIKWLVPNSLKNEMEPIYLTILPGHQLNRDMAHEGEEFGYILEGSIVLCLGKTTHNVSKGESFYFQANKPHLIKNISNKVAKLIWVSSPPTF